LQIEPINSMAVCRCCRCCWLTQQHRRLMEFI